MTETMELANMSSLKDMYLKLLSTHEGSDVMEICYNPVMHKVRTDLYFDLIREMKTSYNLKDEQILGKLIKIDMEYRMIKEDSERKYKNKPVKVHDLNEVYDKSLRKITELLDEAELFDDEMIFRYFKMIKKYHIVEDKELLEEFYESYFSKQTNVSSMFELYKLLKLKGMPDSDFKEIFGAKNYEKINIFISKFIQHLTMPN
jgi:hypothetical protein